MVKFIKGTGKMANRVVKAYWLRKVISLLSRILGKSQKGMWEDGKRVSWLDN